MSSWVGKLVTVPIGHSRWEMRSVVLIGLLIVVGLVVLFPFALLLQSSFLLSLPGELAIYGLSGWRDALTEPGIRDALVNTITLTLTRVGISVVVATFIAWVLARTDIAGAGWLEFGFWIGFFLPALPVVLGWILVFDPEFGLANTAIVSLFGTDKGPFDIYSWWGIVWAHLTTVLIAVMVMLLTPAFRNMDASLEEASSMSGASGFMSMLRITIPLMMPAILLATLFTTIRLFEAFEVELILGLPDRIDVYSTKIYRLIVTQQPPQFAAGSALGLLVLAAMTPLVLLHNWFTQRRSYSTVSGKYHAGLVNLGRWRWPVFGLVFLVLGLTTVVPLIFLFMSSFMSLFGFFDIADAWTSEHWHAILNDSQFIDSVWNTFIIAGGTALLSVTGFSVLSYFIVRTRGFGGRALNLLTWVPFMLPGVLLSLGLFWTFLSVPALRPLFGTHAVLILAMTLANLTLGVQLVQTSLAQLGAELEEASWMSGAAWWYTFRRVIVPLIAPAVVTVAMISFASTARNISHIVLLGTSDTRPLSLLQLDYLMDGRYEAAAVVGIVTVLITVLVAVIVRKFGAMSGFGR